MAATTTWLCTLPRRVRPCIIQATIIGPLGPTARHALAPAGQRNCIWLGMRVAIQTETHRLNWPRQRMGSWRGAVGGWPHERAERDPYKEEGTRIGRLNPRKPCYGSSYLSSPRIKGEKRVIYGQHGYRRRRWESEEDGIKWNDASPKEEEEEEGEEKRCAGNDYAILFILILSIETAAINQKRKQFYMFSNLNRSD